MFLFNILRLTNILIACYSCANENEDTTPRPCFMPFCFNAPGQLTLLFNLHLLLFGSTPWLVYFHLLQPFFFLYDSIIFGLFLFDLCPLFQEHN